MNHYIISDHDACQRRGQGGGTYVDTPDGLASLEHGNIAMLRSSEAGWDRGEITLSVVRLKSFEVSEGKHGTYLGDMAGLSHVKVEAWGRGNVWMPIEKARER